MMEGEDFLHAIHSVLIGNDHPCKLNVECEVIDRIDGRSQNDKGEYGFGGGAVVCHEYCSHITVERLSNILHNISNHSTYISVY